MIFRFFYFLYTLNFISNSVFAQSPPVPKTYGKPVLMHYMPWFETPEFNGIWGWHWTMNNQNPDIIIDTNTGKRQIASHFYPLIGPYSSIDPDVIEYHLLLMKYMGVDVVIIDWYGVSGSNADISNLLVNSNAIIDKTQELGLQFAIILEDRFSSSITDVQQNLSYANSHYFNRSNYFRFGQQNKPVVGIFGPITFQNESDWNLIMPYAVEDINLLTLWNQSNEVGSNASGEYAWIFEIDENNDHLNYLHDFYTNNAPILNIVMGVAYPGFEDFYFEGGAGDGYFTIEHSSTQTLTETLQLLTQYESDIDLVQLATWNDFGEGTIYEPTYEFGFTFLTTIQDFLGVSFNINELEQIYRLFELRKQHQFDSDIQQVLDGVFLDFSLLNPNQATSTMDAIENGTLSNYSNLVNNISIYPNPFMDEIKIDFNHHLNTPIKINIYNINGELLENIDISSSNKTIYIKDLTKYDPGIYIINLISDYNNYNFTAVKNY